MPFVEILHQGDHADDLLLLLRDRLIRDVASVIERYDPRHRLTSEMVDVRVMETGPLDLLHPDLLVTILARHEPDRDRHKEAIVRELTETVTTAVPGSKPMVELVLTNRTSVYKYSDS